MHRTRKALRGGRALGSGAALQGEGAAWELPFLAQGRRADPKDPPRHGGHNPDRSPVHLMAMLGAHQLLRKKAASRLQTATASRKTSPHLPAQPRPTSCGCSLRPGGCAPDSPALSQAWPAALQPQPILAAREQGGPTQGQPPAGHYGGQVDT